MSSEKLSKEKQDYKIHETEDWIDALQLALPIFIYNTYEGKTKSNYRSLY